MSQDDVKATVSQQTETSEVPGKRPYLIVLEADFGAQERLNKLTTVDPDALGDVLRAARPTIAVALPDPLSEGGADWEFTLTFDSMRAFEPVGVLNQIAPARWRLGIREKVLQRRTGGASADELNNAIRSAVGAEPSLRWLTEQGPASATPSAPAPDVEASQGASILDMVDEPDESARARAEIERMAAGSQASLSATEVKWLETVRQRLDRELGKIANAVLKQPGVRRLERAWRSVNFLLDRIDFREGNRLAILHAPREHAANRLLECVIDPAFDGQTATPGMVLFDYPCENTANNIAMLDELAQHAVSLPVPVVFPLTAAFFNVKNLRLLKNLPNFSNLTDGWEYAKWRTLREQPYSRTLVPVVGRFVLRSPYEPKSDPRTFSFQEEVKTVNDILWAHGHLALAVCAARSYANHGWPTRMFGSEAGRLENLPVVPNPNDPQSPWGPGDLVLPDRRLDELPQIGINLLLSMPRNDACILLGGVAAARPVKTQDGSERQAALEISLPYQQFANIAGAFLCEQAAELRGLNEEQIQMRLLGSLSALLRIQPEDDPEAIQVGVGPNPEDPTRKVIQVRLQPPGRIVPGGLTMDFGFAV